MSEKLQSKKMYVFDNKNGRAEWSTLSEHEDQAWSAAANLSACSVSYLLDQGHSVNPAYLTRDPERYYNK